MKQGHPYSGRLRMTDSIRQIDAVGGSVLFRGVIPGTLFEIAFRGTGLEPIHLRSTGVRYIYFTEDTLNYLSTPRVSGGKYHCKSVLYQVLI